MITRDDIRPMTTNTLEVACCDHQRAGTWASAGIIALQVSNADGGCEIFMTPAEAERHVWHLQAQIEAAKQLTCIISRPTKATHLRLVK